MMTILYHPFSSAGRICRRLPGIPAAAERSVPWRARPDTALCVREQAVGHGKAGDTRRFERRGRGPSQRGRMSARRPQ